ncbi:MAG: bifunctional diguanylate cyclase/phosphodiesterase [Mycobacterium sp.]
MSDSLELVVTSTATKLMAATSTNTAEVLESVLADLVEAFAVDHAFLRYNDHQIRASRLIAEWPPRPDIPDPDPIGLVYFADDPVFAMAECAKQPLVLRPEPATDEFQRLIEESGGYVSTFAAAPLISGEITTGTLGFVKSGDREWLPRELSAVEAIASLLAQVQGRIAAEDQLRHLADHDDLTRVHNRRALVAHLGDRLKARRRGPVAVLFFDLDRLKAINDYLGHNAGDRFIRVFADRLRETVGDRCLIARLGGDEFVVVPNSPMTAEAARELATELQSALRERVSIDGEMLTRTVSIGVALGTPGQDSTSDLLRKAGHAVLNAKNDGGNVIAVYSEDLALKAAFRNDIELHLQGVVESDALVLHYLPEIDMRTGEVLATEALVRWQHPTRGLLLPDSFIGVAESINLAGELGRWVMRRACAEFSSWRARGIGQHATLRLNVSPVQLVSEGFAEAVAETLADFDLPGESVCLEITESLVVQDIETTRITLAALKEVGVQIAIDDFGTGYSVLTHLKSLPVDTLKIDRSFVRDLGENAGDLAIVRAVIALADAFGLAVVAEGVETSAAAEILLRHGCYRAQGFLLSRPLSSAAMSKLFARKYIELPFATSRRAVP